MVYDIGVGALGVAQFAHLYPHSKLFLDDLQLADGVFVYLLYGRG